MMCHQNMMLVDSATPMFTSEFTIIAAPTMMMGGLDTGMGIHEWNPLGSLHSMEAPQQLHHSAPGLHHQHSVHSHDSFYGGGGPVVHSGNSGSELQSAFNLRL
jgi:hypothetical protein